MLRAHDWRWKTGGGYYTSQVGDLEQRPLLPDLRKRRDREIARIFEDIVPASGYDILELGCGASRWLPYLALNKDCRMTGLDYEPSAVELTLANLRGAGVSAEIFCRDAFSLMANTDLVGRFDLVYSMGLLEHFADVVGCLRAVREYLRPSGLILTTVPNLQGVNWLLQRFGDLRVLETHVVYDVARLCERHREAGFETLAAGYLGFYDGYLSAVAPDTPRSRRLVHQAICRYSNLLATAWLTSTRGGIAPDLPFLAPTVYFVGRRVE